MKSACLKLVSKFDDRDSDLVFSAIDDYRMIGLPPEKAQVAAVRDALRVLEAERDSVQIASQFGNMRMSAARTDSDIPDVDSVQPSDFKTGAPIRFNYLRNTAGVRQFDNGQYGSDIEPFGRYMLFNEANTTPESNDRVKWEKGVVQFNSPLVIDADNWKQDLSKQFGGLTGKALTDAVRASGYDAIVTRDKYGVGEIVDMTGVAKKKSSKKVDDQPRNLILAHNLTAENLRAAMDIGGLPAPSLAITKVDAPIQGFGEITLIGNTDLATPSAKNPVYDADVYSPRFPDVRVKVDEKAVKDAIKPLADAAKAAGLNARGIDFMIEEMERNRLSGAIDGALYDIGLRLGYANAVLGKGLTVPTKQVKEAPRAKAGGSIVEQSPLRELLPTMDLSTIKPSTSGDLGQKVYAALLNKTLADMGTEASTPEGLTKALGLVNRRINIFANTTIESGSTEFEIDKVGLMSGRGLDAIINLYRNTQQGDGAAQAAAAVRTETDFQALNEALDREAPREQVAEWLREKLRPAMGERRIVKDNGRTADFTLDNIVKEMTRKVRDAEGFNYGLGNARSKGATKFKNLKQIQGRRDLVVSKETFEEARKEIDAEFSDLSSKVAPFQKYKGDSSSELLAEAIGNSYSVPLSKALEDAALVNVPADIQQRIAEFAGALVNAPTEYFEAKPQRAVSLDEFRGAVVPSDTPSDVLNMIDSLGLDVETYDKSDAKSRNEAVKRLAEKLNEASGDVLFSRARPTQGFHWEHQGIASKESKDNLVRTWTKYAEDDSGFAFGRNDGYDSSNAYVIANAFGVGIFDVSFDAPTFLTKPGAEFNDGSLSLYKTEDGVKINSMYVSPARNGAQLYQAAFAWIHNNNLKTGADVSITEIGMMRRTSALLSSILRFGSSDFVGETEPVFEASGNFEDDVSTVAQRELELVREAVPGFDEFRISQEGQVFRVEGRDSGDPMGAFGPMDSASDRAPFGAAAAQREQGEVSGYLVRPASIGLAAVAQTQDGARNVRQDDRNSRGYGRSLARDSSSAGVGQGVSRSPVDDRQLGRYLASVGGGFEKHGVGVNTFKRALVTRAALDGGVISVPGQVLYSRSGSNQGLPIAQVEAMADRIASEWANPPGVIVVDSMSDPRIPKEAQEEDARQLSDGATGTPAAFYHKGFVYLIASQLKSNAAVADAMFHESLGHYGMRRLFGQELTNILNDIVDVRRQDVIDRAREYGLTSADVKTASDEEVFAGMSSEQRMKAAEEVLAFMAQEKPGLSFVRRAIAVIRTWLRNNIPSLAGMYVTDDQIINGVITPARRFVEQGLGAAKYARDTSIHFQRVSHPEAETAEGQQSIFDQTPYTADTITIDGKERSALNSEGRRIADTEEWLRNFWRWFGDSGVVDDQGRPLAVYHASQEEFNEFKPQSWGTAGDHQYFYFAASKQWSKRFAKEEMANSKPVLRSFYLSLQNPLDMRGLEEKTGKDWLTYFSELGIEPKDNLRGKLEAASSRLVIPAWQLLRFDTPELGGIREQLLEKGYDGLILPDVLRGKFDNTTYVAFRPEQIKSATGNNGQFDQANPDIRKSAARPWFEDAANLKVTSTYQLGDLLDTSKKMTWWDKSVGTMYHVAQRHPEFKRAYDAIQGFIGDISTYANRSADLAPTILPKLENWKDITAKPLSAEDVRALRDPVFGGTLNYSRDDNGEIQDEQDVQKAGVVFTDQELRGIFGLNDRQIGLYHEIRSAIDQSIADLAVSDMIRYLGKDGVGIEKAAMEAGDVDSAVDVIRDHLEDMADADPSRADVLNGTMEAIQEKADKAKGLMAKGYAPLSRFGQYTVYVVDQNGDQLYFSMFENERDANVMAREMREQYPQAQVTTGVMSQESYKLFSGITPETLELFGESLGLEQSGLDAKDEAFQQYLKLAKTNRSAMKRLIHRKGIDGFSEDAGRVLAGFVVSNARQTATNLHASEIAQSVSSIKDGDVKDAAIRMMEHVQNPREEAQALRGLMFANFIGGSLASAAVNLTQPFTMTLPYLSQFDGAAGAGRRMVDALKLASRGITGDDDLKTALKQAEDDGVVSPQEIFQLMGQAQGKGALMSGDGTKMGDARAKANNALAKLGLAWGKVFSAAEQFNRRVTFVAAYKLARDKGMADPFAFAEKAVNETQGVFNKGNKPQWARGAVGATLFTFKQYSIAYVEFLQRMWGNGPEGKKAVGLALGVLFLVSGLGGLPGADDLDDVIDGIMQRVFGKSFNSKQKKREFLAELLGEGGADFVLSGVSGLPGAPIDVSGRMGLGNLIPGTGFLTKKQDYQRDAMEIFGPAGTMVSNWASAAGSLAQGDVTKAAERVSPLAVQNVLKAVDMATMGQYRDGAGRKVIDTNGWEAAVKAIGFQPSSVKRIQDATSVQQNLIAQNRMREAEIVDLMVKGRVERKPDLLDDARRQLADWNKENPDSQIKVNQSQINRRVQQANMDKAKRLANAAPKEIRQNVAKELAIARP